MNKNSLLNHFNRKEKVQETSKQQMKGQTFHTVGVYSRCCDNAKFNITVILKNEIVVIVVC